MKDKELLYTLFTYEYGKIKANKKFSLKEKNLDLWYIINFEIITEENKIIHKIKNIKIKSQFNTNKSFAEINIYLEILWVIFKEIPDWIPNKEIFEMVESINNYKNIDEAKLVLAKLKLKDILWDLNISNDNKIIERILKFIHNSKIDDILRLKWIDEDLKNDLKKI